LGRGEATRRLEVQDGDAARGLNGGVARTGVGQTNHEVGAAVWPCAFDLDRAAMQFDQVTGDGQAETEAAVPPREAAVGLAKAVEHERQKFRIDALAG